MTDRTDRKLLEAAAKAAGILIRGWGEPDFYSQRVGYVAYASGSENGEWNPLTDDGDALRLAVKLRIDVTQFDDTVRAYYWSDAAQDGLSSIDIDHGDDPCAATRRAIVRAAAAMSPD